MAQEIRVRFAPSPTGPFHIGGARSALFNWLLARKLGGKMVLRIEDTDRKRSTPESEENIKAALKWLGMDWDEGVDVGGPYGPYHQMERLAIYKKYTDQLLAEGKAYYCYCTPEELEEERQALLKEGKMPRYMGKCRHLTAEQRAQYEAEGRKPSIRLKVPADEKIVVHDLVRGDVEFDSNDIGDFVIVKSDGIPTYNYAVVIDDYLMHITHVIRAEEHLSNTPRQLLVYEALGFEKPVFGHISLILGPDHTKMSKRHGATSVDAYRRKGYIPEGLDNFLALLGWAPSGEKEIFTMEEAIREFSLEHMAKNPAIFDFKKLDWINGQHIRLMTPEAFFNLAKPFMVEAGCMTGDETGERLEWLRKVIATAQTQVDYGAQIPEKVAFYFTDEFEFESEEAAAVLHEETVPLVLRSLKAELEALPVLDRDGVKACFKKVQKGNKLKGQQVYMPVRVALTGSQHGPELAEMIPLMGLERVERRVAKSLARAGITL